MVTLAFLLFIGALGVPIGGHIHDLTLSSVCRLDVKIRVGDVVSWINPTEETISLAGEGCHTKLNVTILSKHTIAYMFQNRGVFRYRTSPPCNWKLGIIRVKRKIFSRDRTKRSNPRPQVTPTKSAKCISLCNAVKITDLSSGNLCRRNFDYVIHGKVLDYKLISTNKIVKKYVLFEVLDDFRQNVSLKTNVSSSNNTSVPFLWMSQNEACFCPALKLDAQVLMMGYRSGLELVIDSRTSSRKWEPKLTRQLSAYRRKVNTSPCI